MPYGYHDHMVNGWGGGWIAMLVMMVLLIMVVLAVVWLLVGGARRFGGGRDPTQTWLRWGEVLAHSESCASNHRPQCRRCRLRLQVERSGVVAQTVICAGCTQDPHGAEQRRNHEDPEDGRYWARTSDPQLVELVLSQLS